MSAPAVSPATIVFVVTALQLGGAETMLFRLIERLDRSRFKASVISLSDDGHFGPLLRKIQVPVTALHMSPGRIRASHVRELTNIIRHSRPDIVQTWMYHADLLGGIAARWAGVRRVSWGIRHSNLSPTSNKASTLLTVKLCSILSHCVPTSILSCSERAKDVHISAGYSPRKITVIPNGFDHSHFLPDASARSSVRDELKLTDATRLVGMIARYHPLKNHNGFIEAAAIVSRAAPGTHFLLAGDKITADNPTLRAAIHAAGLQHVIHLLGRRNDVPRLMAGMDLLVSSSTGEAFPNVLGEAMACGTPCVATDAGDSAEIVGDTGSIVAVGDMNQLAEKILMMLARSSEDRSALGVAARQRIIERYDIAAVTRRYEEYFSALIGSGRE